MTPQAVLSGRIQTCTVCMLHNRVECAPCRADMGQNPTSPPQRSCSGTGAIQCTAADHRPTWHTARQGQIQWTLNILKGWTCVHSRFCIHHQVASEVQIYSTLVWNNSAARPVLPARAIVQFEERCAELPRDWSAGSAPVRIHSVRRISRLRKVHDVRLLPSAQAHGTPLVL